MPGTRSTGFKSMSTFSSSSSSSPQKCHGHQFSNFLTTSLADLLYFITAYRNFLPDLYPPFHPSNFFCNNKITKEIFGFSLNSKLPLSNLPAHRFNPCRLTSLLTPAGTNKFLKEPKRETKDGFSLSRIIYPCKFHTGI